MEAVKKREQMKNMPAAANPNTPSKVLARLAKDERWSVRQAVAANPNTTLEVLALLAKDTDGNIRAAVAHNPNTKRR